MEVGTLTNSGVLPSDGEIIVHRVAEVKEVPADKHNPTRWKHRMVRATEEEEIIFRIMES